MECSRIAVRWSALLQDYQKHVVEAIQAGRTRWKIENENNNTLKTKGYHF